MAQKSKEPDEGQKNTGVRGRDKLTKDGRRQRQYIHKRVIRRSGNCGGELDTGEQNQEGWGKGSKTRSKAQETQIKQEVE